MNNKIDILKQILLMSTGEYYEINLTRDRVLGTMYQVIDGVKYNINEKLGLDENTKFSEVIFAWGKSVPEEEKAAFFEFFDAKNLIARYNRGENHICHTYRTKTVLFEPMAAEQHIFMYKDEETKEIFAYTYIKDITEKLNGEAYKKELENKLEISSERLMTEKKYLDVLYRNYILAYHLDVKKNTAEVLNLSKRAHVWGMPDMYTGAHFDFDKHIKDFEKRFITSGNETFLKKLDRKYISSVLKKKERFSFCMECVPNFSGNRNYEIWAVRVNKTAFDGRVIIVSEEIDNRILAEKRHKAQLNTERKYLETLTGDFVAVYHVDLKENKSVLIKVDKDIDGYDADKASLRQENNYMQRVLLYAEKFVAEEQKEGFKKVMRPEYISKELKKSARFVYRYRTGGKGGKQKFFEIQAMHLSENADKCDVLIAFRDIDDVVTAQQRRQVELEEKIERERSQNEVFAALGNSFSTIFGIDLKNDSYEILRLREETSRFYEKNKPASEELKSLCEKYIVPEHREKTKKFFDLKTLPERMAKKESIEAECLTTDGDWRRIKFVAKRREADGNLSHVLYVTQKISDEKNREERLISIAEAAKEANEAKTEFVSKVAHDIRTPMNSLFGFLQIAEANTDDPEKLKYSLRKIRVAGEFLKELVNDVLDITKMENGKMTFSPKEISVNELFEELPTSMRGSDFGKNIEFNFNIHDIFCDKVIGDPLRLKQIYTNILSNAVKYTNDGGKVDFEVFEEKETDEDKILLAVKITDTGIGMSEEFMGKMFSKFERETDTRLNSVSGYGLGLTIVKQLVDAMDGKIDVKSKKGCGTCFTVELTLPCAETEKEKVRAKKNYKEECKGMYLLVAEDNSLSREVTKELLLMNDILCDTAEDGAQCLKMLTKTDAKKYDAVLMDIQMPNMNGIDTTKRIRQLDEKSIRDIPIVAMTANALGTDVTTCMEAGMNEHLSKPIDIKKLLKVLAKLKKQSTEKRDAL